MSDQNVGRFFDSLTSDYTAAIERCFPRYREMLWAVMDYLPQGRQFESILELGCGTGNLSVLLHEVFPRASLHVVDLSKESLDVCRTRLPSIERFVFDQQNFESLDYQRQSFDLVVSSIAIHHIDGAAKQSLFERIHQWLTEDGVLCFADQCAGATDDLYARHLENWKRLSFAAGTTDSEWQMWMQHQSEHDHHDTLLDQIDWLREAGFSVVDCPWRYVLWSVIQARK
jgi:tRNA (cmo5U34)-methyltransferase